MTTQEKEKLQKKICPDCGGQIEIWDLGFFGILLKCKSCKQQFSNNELLNLIAKN